MIKVEKPKKGEKTNKYAISTQIDDTRKKYLNIISFN